MTERAEFYIKGRELLPEPYHFRASGLPNVYLLNGVRFEDDPEHGALVTFENLKGLQHAIGLHLIEKPAALTGAQFRYLRKLMGLTQDALARVMRVSVQTIANYEKEHTASLGPADPHLRLLFALHILPSEMAALLLQSFAREEPRKRIPDRSRRKIVGRWREQAMAA